MSKTWETVNCEGAEDPEPQMFLLGGLFTWGLQYVF